MKEAEFLEQLVEMQNRIIGLILSNPIRKSIAELRAETKWEEWSDASGLYYFVHNDEVVYVGRAFPSVCIGNRIGTRLDTRNDQSWTDVIDDEQTTVGLIPFPPDDWHWVAAIEVKLIDAARPKFNKRL
jgi:hypothetical protein